MRHFCVSGVAGHQHFDCDLRGSARSSVRLDTLRTFVSKRREKGLLRHTRVGEWAVLTTYFSKFLLFGFCFKSFRSLLRPGARLLAMRSSREMKCTGTPKNVLATLFVHASANSTPVISVRISMRTGATDKPTASP